MSRRWSLAAVAAGGLLTIIPAVATGAPSDWAGSEFRSSGPTATATPNIDATFVRLFTRTSPATRQVVASTTVTAPSDLPTECPPPVVGTTAVISNGSNHGTRAQLTTSCNGSYSASVTARLQERTCSPAPIGCGPWRERSGDSFTVTGTVDVGAPAPPPTAVTATAAPDPADDRSVVVGWTPPAGPPPDFLGYRVERVSASGTTVVLADVGRDTTSYTDLNPPAEGGVTTYRVYSRRRAPGGEVASPASSATAEVTPDPTAPGPDTDGGTDGGSGGTGTGGTGTGGGSGGTGTGGTGTDGGSGGTGSGTGGTGSGGRPAGSVRVPRVGTPSRNFFPPLLSPPRDEGFDEELPFDDAEPGGEDAVLPDDLASGPYDGGPGRGLMIPFATGMVLAVWAFHLRFLAGAAAPQYVEVDELPLLDEW